MQSPPVIYATPSGILTPRIRAAAVLAFMEHMRVSLPPVLPCNARGR